MRKGLALAAIASLPLLAWGFWPLGDPKLEIRFDPAATRAAKEFLAQPVAPSAKAAPNVVLIVADDLGKHDISVYGASPTPTPALTELAARGVTFSSGYVTAPVCSPSRAALLTGRHQQRFGFELLTHDRYPRNRVEWWFARTFFSTHGWHALARPTAPTRADMERQGLPPSEITLAELLKKHGYRTAIFGKWHLGFGEQTLPLNRGFDRQYGFYDAFSLYADPDDAAIVSSRGSYFADRYQWWRGRRGGSAIRRDGVVVEEKGYLTMRIADEAAAWIEANRDGPFFAYVPFSAPHAPLQAPRSYADRFAAIDDPDKRVYYGMIAALDDAVARILEGLDRLGIAEETLVIFLSDNGAASYTGIVDNAPLAGGKLTDLEGGINVPLLARWPDGIPQGVTYTKPVSTMDVFMTIARAAGVELPSDRPYDGVDLLPHLTKATDADPHDALFWRAMGHRAVRAGRYKLLSDARTGARALFDLETDPYEKNDLIEEKPDLADELERRFRAWEASLAAPAWPPAMEYRFSYGGQEFVFPL